jgi:hypothetical protein
VLVQGNYPERLKLSLIKPIYKSGDKSSPSNYRPISLFLAFSKIFEKRLFGHLNNNAILNEHKYGFRSEVSTENTSHILLNEILAAVNINRWWEEYFVTSTRHLTVLIMLCYWRN